MLEFLHERVIQFNGKILGFEDLNEFVILVVEANGPYAYLQSVADEHIGFLVVSPFAFYQDYMFEIDENDKEQLELHAPEDAAVLSIVNMKEPFTESTINLLAPLVINVRTGKGKQIVLPPRTVYTTKEPLFRSKQTERGVEPDHVNSDA
jgi:flagellar assembly factor FliW